MALYAVVLAVVLGLLGWQALRADALAEEVAVLQGELSVARADIRIHEERMGVVRNHVDDLSARIGALRTLVTGEVSSVRNSIAD